jgi:hypothetical protein
MLQPAAYSILAGPHGTAVEAALDARAQLLISVQVGCQRFKVTVMGPTL